MNTNSQNNQMNYRTNNTNNKINTNFQKNKSKQKIKSTKPEYSNVTNVNVGLYVPLTSFVNVNDVQSLVIYSRVGHESMFTGAIVEFYNRSIDSTLSSPIISTPEIDVSAVYTYRFDFPSLYTYNCRSLVLNSV